MKYQVIARKFRPQAFEEVVGQNPIVQTIRNAIEMDRIGHAYLFSGPRGVGKTTMARLLAKALNCAEGPTPSPCNACASCTEISGGGSIDVLEIDAASNTGVDSIRELRENARYSPSRDRFKIFIVDEVHMLSTSAFNALLKTLEEPPPHIVFIMATTERHKLPATILSRCQQFIFRSISPSEIRAHLSEIASREGADLGDRSLDHIVRAAGGSMRDAQSLLDQIIAFGGQQISDEDVRDVLGFMPANLLGKALEALASRDAAALLEVVGILGDQGLNLQQFVREFLGEIRNLLLSKLGQDEKIPGAVDDRERSARLAAAFSEQDLIRFFDQLLQIESQLRWTSEPRFHLEVGCIKLTRIGKLRDLEDVIADLQQPGAPVPADRDSPPVRGRQPFRAESRGADSPPPPPPDPEAARAAAASSKRQDGPRAASPAPESPSPTASEPDAPSSPRATAPESVSESADAEPMVRSFLDVFKGEIAQVRRHPDPSKSEDGS